MAISDTKYTIGKYKCFVASIGGKYYLQQNDVTESNKDIFTQFGLSVSDLGILVEQDFSSNRGSFPYHPSRETLIKTIDVLIFLAGYNLGSATRSCIYTKNSSGGHFVFAEPPHSGYSLTFPEKVSNTVSKGIFNPGDRITGFTKAGRDITTFNKLELGYFLIDKIVRTYNVNLQMYDLQIWDEVGFLDCFENDLKHWVKPIEKHLFKAGDKLVGKSRYGSDITAPRSEKLPYYIPDKVVYSHNMTMLELWKDGACWHCYESDIRHYEEPTSKPGIASLDGWDTTKATDFSNFRPATVIGASRQFSNPFLTDEAGVWPMLGTPLIFGTGGQNTNPCKEMFLPPHVKNYPLTPSEAYKGRIKPVLLSPIKIKKRPLI